MQVELTQETQELLQTQIARDGFSSSDEAIERAIQFYESHRPTMESLNAQLREAHRSAIAGETQPLDVEDIKRRGRQRLNDSQTQTS